MQFSLRHGLTKQASSDLLTLVGEHFPSNSIVTLYKLRKLSGAVEFSTIPLKRRLKGKFLIRLFLFLGLTSE